MVHLADAPPRTADFEATLTHVNRLRKSGVARWKLWAYKTVFTLDGPVQLFGKSIQYLWRRATGAQVEKAEKK